MKMNPIIEPKDIPQTRPQYTPTAPKPNRNAKTPAKITSSKNDLRIVSRSDSVPFPID